MLLPSTYLITLLLTIFTMLCWGSWANTFKLTGKWRFELFYFDYSAGVLLGAIVLALTFGTLGYDGFEFMDDLLHAGRRQDLYGFAGGVIFNLANMLLVAAISVAGMAVAFPVGIGVALVIGVIWNYILAPHGSPALLFGGSAVIVAAIVVDAMAYKTYALARAEEFARTGKSKSTKKVVSLKGIALALAAGVLMGSFFPLVEMGKGGELGLGPYAIGFVFALGVFLSTFVFNMFFMNLPVEGRPVDVIEYFRGNFKQHALGILGGLVWIAGTVANFVAASAQGKAQVGPAVSYAIGQGATMISALWGLLVWKEFAGADQRVRMLLGIMLVLFIVGLGLVSIAPLFP